MAGNTFSRLRTRLTLDPGGGWIGGVCAGVARHLGTDPAFVRTAVIISGLFFPKLTVAAYLIAWVTLDDVPRS